MKTSKTIFILFFYLISLSVFSQEQNFGKLSRYFDSLDVHNKFMGSVALSKNGKLVYQKTIGYLDYENRVKSNDSTKYRIGSISKTFTAVLIMKVVEEGKINLNDKLTLFYPKVKNSDKISIENLLNHRSGIPSFTSNPLEYLKWNTLEVSKEDILEKIYQYKSDFEPNSKYDYSNTNYVLLSYILEDIYQMSFNKILNDKIVKPLELKHTMYKKHIEPSNNECFSYSGSSDWELSSETNNFIPLGAGGLISTASDLTKFSYALFTDKVLTNESVNKMKKMTDDYGYALYSFPFNEKIFYGHGGNIDEFSSIFGFNTEDSTAFSYLSNGTKIVNNNISIQLLKAFYGIDFNIPKFKEIKVSSEELEKYVGNYSSSTFPLKVKVFIKNSTLFAQAETQPSFPLTAEAINIFTFEQIDVKMTFNSKENSMVLKQYGKEFEFEKVK